MFALVDCNNFFVSCERVFRPDLRNKPVVVLSNNDLCIVARSNEVKKLGIKMGVPVFQVKDLIWKHGIIEFSSNYTLYADMSARVMSLLSSYVQDIEIYSIDEAFLNFNGFDFWDLKEYGHKIVKEVSQGTGIPLSMGIASTKTLAKIANHFAKRYPAYKDVCMIDSEEKRIRALELTELGDVWGIGRNHRKLLNSYGAKTAYDFACMPMKWVRQKMTVTGERMWKELNGIPCIEFELEEPSKKQICTSRVFVNPLTGLEDLKESVSTYASICAEKLRIQNGYAVSLVVFLHLTGYPFQIFQRMIHFPVPTNSTMEIVRYALYALNHLYQDGYSYKKAGVIITEIIPDDAFQQNLFDKVDRKKQGLLMNVVDRLNRGFSRNLLTLGIQGTDRSWKLKQDKLSPCYTTKFKDILCVK